MFKFLTPFAVSLAFAMSLPAAAAEPFIGTWKSVTHDKGALPGLITFQPGGELSMQPVGFALQTGKWKRLESKRNTLVLTLTDVGSTEVGYRTKGGKLVLTYDNGNSQEFKKQPK